MNRRLPLFEERLEREFTEFDRANPEVFRRLKRICLQVRRRGVRHFGIRMVWERLRWLTTFETTDAASDYRLNDHYHAFYARRLMAEVPELAGVFELRHAVADEDIGRSPEAGRTA